MSLEFNLEGNHGNVHGTSAGHRRRNPHERSISPPVPTHVETIEEGTISVGAVIAGLLIGAMIFR